MRRLRQPPGPRSRLAIGLLFILGGLGIFTVSVWLALGELGPTTDSAGRVVNLTTSSSARSGTAYEVDLAWDDGKGSIISEDLYAALYPLAGPVPVTLDRSTLTGMVLRVQLAGTRYENEMVSGSPGVIVAGIVGLAAAIVLGRLLLGARR